MNNSFVAVGDYGTILTSANGSDWTKNPSGTQSNLRSVIYGSNSFVAVGDYGAILTSGNAVDWTPINSGTPPSSHFHAMNDVTFGNNTFLAVGAGIFSSPDGERWNRQGPDISNGYSLYGVTYGNNTFVAVGQNRSILTSPDGTNWGWVLSGSTESLLGVAYGNETFVAVGMYGLLLRSSDGLIWEEVSLGNTGHFSGVTFGNDRFVAIGSGMILIGTPDGRSWISRTSVDYYGLSGIAFGVINGNDTFVAVGADGKILTSPDGLTWTAQNSGTSEVLTGITYGNNTFVALGRGNKIYTSEDGATWRWRNAANSLGFYAAVYGNNTFVAVGYNQHILQSGPLTTTPQPNIYLSPSSFDFGNVPPGTASTAQTFTISNKGGAGLALGENIITGPGTDFHKQDDNCTNVTLAPAAACTLQVFFQPGLSGFTSANLAIPSNDPDAPTLIVALTGTGSGGGIVPLDTTITAHPAPMTNSTTAEFSFTSTDAGATFECQFNGTDYAACTSPNTYPDLADGSYTFNVRAKDGYGKVDLTPAGFAWTVDTTAPDTTITAQPESLSNSLTAGFSFSSTETGVSFECQLDTGSYTLCTSPISYPVTDGMHTFNVRAKDGAGNLDSTPATYTWVVDTSAPETTITAHPPVLTNNTNVDFSFISSVADSTFECQVDGNDFQACTSPFFHPGLKDGTHIFEVKAKDGAGNVDPSPASYTWTVDTLPPETAITAHPAPLTNSLSATFAYKSDDDEATFECRLDDLDFVSCTNPITLVHLLNGTHTFYVRAKDKAGNVDPTPATWTWTVDWLAPDTIITLHPPLLTNSPGATFEFISTEAESTFECQLDDGVFSLCSSPRTFIHVVNGTHTFRVRAIDKAGNVDPTPAAWTWTVDTIAPDTVITAQPDQLTNSSAAEFSFSATETGTTFECQLDGAGYESCSSPKPYTGLAEGIHTFMVRAKDGLENTDPSPAGYTWSINMGMVDRALNNWHWRNPLPQGNTLSGGVAYGNNIFVTVGNHGTVLTSTDGGNTWTYRPSETTATLWGVAFGNNTFATVGDRGTILTSADGGISWSDRSYGTAHNLNGVVYGNNAFVVVGDQCLILVSVDGAVTWSPVVSGTLSDLHAITYGNNTFMAVGEFGTVLTSTDGQTWTDRSSGNSLDNLQGVAYDNGKFVAVGGQPLYGTILTTSDSGQSWSRWGYETSFFHLYGVTFGNGKFVAVGAGGRIMTSATGDAWTTSISSELGHGYGITYANNTFVAVGEWGSILTSIDGDTWTDRTPGIRYTFRGIAYGDGTFVEVGETVKILKSSDGGTNWFKVNSGITELLYGITYGNNTFVAVGQRGKILTSNDEGLTWISRTSGTTAYLQGVTYGNNTFVAVGDSGTVLTSPDGVVWTPRNSGTTSLLFDVTYGDGTFIAVGEAGTIVQSDNLITYVIPETTLIAKPQNPTNIRYAYFTFSSTDPEATFECQLDGGDYLPCATPWSSSRLPDGSHTFNVRAIDGAGSIYPIPASYTWTIDNVPPETTITSYPDGLTHSSTAVFTFIANEPGSVFECKLDGIRYFDCPSPMTYSNLLDGSHTFSVLAFDQALNIEQTGSTYTWTIHTQDTITVTAGGPAAPSRRQGLVAW